MEPRLTAATVVLIPLLAVESIGMVLAAILMFPLLALELALLGIAGMCLGLVRAAGLARQRVDVTCWSGHHLHSETVLLMHGRRRARQLVEQVAAERSAAPRSFEPSKLPADVTVRSHRSIWQAPDKWIPKTTSPSDSTNKQIMKTRLVILTAGACAILLVVSILKYYFE